MSLPARLPADLAQRRYRGPPLPRRRTVKDAKATSIGARPQRSRPRVFHSSSCQHHNAPSVDPGLGCSRGGFGTKVHNTVDRLGNPLRFILMGGQEHDITQAEALLDGYSGEYVIGDKGYDAQGLRHYIAAQGMTPVIPGRSNRKIVVVYDQHLYPERHLVECFIGKIKRYRRVFTRFEKLSRRYLGFLHFAATLIWLR